MAEKNANVEKEKVENNALLSRSVAIFTDGSSRGNPGPGGFAAIVVKHDDSRIHADKTQINADDSGINVVELGGREEHTTNNRMELQAAIEALSFLSSLRIKPARRSLGAGGDKARPPGLRPSEVGRGLLRISVYTDSAYLLNGITRWIHGWQKNGWKTKGKKDVENRDLWEQLAELITIYRNCEWKLVEGHAGVAGNVRCDEIATAFADGKAPRLYAGVLENYSIKNVLEVPRGLTSSRERSQTSNPKSRSRAAPYSYVSMVDDLIQIHKTWAECERVVKGARGAKHKKVSSVEEENELVKEWRKK